MAAGASRRIAALGECMVELVDQGDGSMRRGFGGDTLNTSVYLSRLGVPVDYVTALGDDPYSEEMLASWRAEGVGTGHVARVPGALPGLYAIRTYADGERSFAYWRWSAPVRTMIRDGHLDAFARRLADFGGLYLSGITLSLFDDAQRDRLFELAQEARRAGLTVAFDTNHRPRCWESLEAARAAYDRMAGIADTVLPSLDDCRAVYADADARAAAERFAGLGAATVIVKCGAEGAGVWSDGTWRTLAPERAVRTVDTTAAGDSFNAGFLAARLQGADAFAAAAAGNRVAGRVVGHPGAIVPKPAFDDLTLLDPEPSGGGKA